MHQFDCENQSCWREFRTDSRRCIIGRNKSTWWHRSINSSVLRITPFTVGILSTVSYFYYCYQMWLETFLISSDVFVSYGSGQSYLLDHRSAGFDDRDVPQLPESKYVAIGSDKSVRTIEGPKGQGHVNMSFAIDSKLLYKYNYKQTICFQWKRMHFMQLNQSVKRWQTFVALNLVRIFRPTLIRCNWSKHNWKVSINLFVNCNYLFRTFCRNTLWQGA